MAIDTICHYAPHPNLEKECNQVGQSRDSSSWYELTEGSRRHKFISTGLSVDIDGLCSHVNFIPSVFPRQRQHTLPCGCYLL